MLRVMGYERLNAHGTTLLIESDEYMPGEDLDIRYLLADGILETYLDHYGFPAGASLTALLLDAFYDDIEIPHWSLDSAVDDFAAIVAKGDELMEWHCDKNELLSVVTIAEDDPEAVAGTWVAIRDANAMRAASFQKLAEERLADEFVSVMPTEARTIPRDLSSASTSQNVESGITFVP